MKDDPDRRRALVIQALQANAEKLRRLGVRHLSLFGSTARGQAHPDSDVDIMAELDPDIDIDLFDYAGIAGEIQSLIPMRIDLARKDRLKPHVARAALRDEVHVF